MKKALLTLSFIAVVVFTFAVIHTNSGNVGKATPSSVTAVQLVTVTGEVTDVNSGEALAGVEVTIEGTSKKVHTDFDGKFKIENVQPGAYNLIASYISYNKSLIEKLKIEKSNEELNIKLQSEY